MDTVVSPSLWTERGYWNMLLSLVCVLLLSVEKVRVFYTIPPLHVNREIVRTVNGHPAGAD